MKVMRWVRAGMIFVTMFLVQSPVNAEGDPRIEFTELVYNFGSRVSGNELQHTFTFSNTGQQLLKIGEVTTSCGCTVTLLSVKEIPPGQSGEIQVTFRTENRNGTEEKEIYVNSNDPVNPKIVLKIKAELKLLLESDPVVLWFSRFESKEPVTKSFKLKGSIRDEINITDVYVEAEDGAGAYSWKINDLRNTEINLFSVSVTLDPKGKKVGRFFDSLIMKTDYPDLPEFHVRLTGEVMGSISSRPMSLIFRCDSERAPITKKLYIRSNNEKPFQITSTSLSDPQFSVDEVTPNKAIIHTLLITLHPDSAFTEKRNMKSPSTLIL